MVGDIAKCSRIPQRSHFSGIGCVVDGFSTDDAVGIRQAHDILYVDTLEEGTGLIVYSFHFLADSIWKLETSGEHLHRSIEVLTKMQHQINDVPRIGVADKI